MNQRLLLSLFVLVFVSSACGYMTGLPPTSTSPPPPTHTQIPTNTPIPTSTPLPPTMTPTPTPTIPPDIWLDSRQFELSIRHPQSTDQPDWESFGEVIIPVDGYVGGVIFTVEESAESWGPSASRTVTGKDSILKAGSMREYPAGRYCVSDYFLSYNPDLVCEILASGSTPLGWITPYFAGYKTQVGVAFNVGGCDPAACTVDITFSKIQLIMYSPE